MFGQSNNKLNEIKEKYKHLFVDEDNSRRSNFGNLNEVVKENNNDLSIFDKIKSKYLIKSSFDLKNRVEEIEEDKKSSNSDVLIELELIKNKYFNKSDKIRSNDNKNSFHFRSLSSNSIKKHKESVNKLNLDKSDEKVSKCCCSKDVNSKQSQNVITNTEIEKLIEAKKHNTIKIKKLSIEQQENIFKNLIKQTVDHLFIEASSTKDLFSKNTKNTSENNINRERNIGIPKYPIKTIPRSKSKGKSNLISFNDYLEESV